MTVPLDERAAPALLAGFLAPAAEMLAAVVPPAGDRRIALVGHWCPLLLAAFQKRNPNGRYLSLEAMPQRVLSNVPSSSGWRAHGRAQPLPLRPGVLGAAVHGLAFSDAGNDAAMLRETVRSLIDGGTYAGAFLMRGSFDAFFDTAREVCEAQRFSDALGALRDAETQFRTVEGLLTAANRAGLADVEVSLEERGLPFGDARAFLTDPAVNNVLLRNLALGDDQTRALVFQHVTTALDTYFSGVAFHARVVTGVLRGKKAA